MGWEDENGLLFHNYTPVKERIATTATPTATNLDVIGQWSNGTVKNVLNFYSNYDGDNDDTTGSDFVVASLYASGQSASFNDDSPDGSAAMGPIRPGYELTGWNYYYSNKNEWRVLTPGSSPSEHTNHYAIWTALNWTVNFDENFVGAPPVTSQAVTGGEVTSAPSTTDRTADGYEFVGWNREADGSGEYVTPTFTVYEDNTTIYAIWAAKDEVIFDANGGMFDSIGGNPASSAMPIATTDGSLEKQPQPPARDGYSFLGWSTSSTGSVNIDPSDDSTDFTGISRVYAVWAEDFDVTFNDNYGTTPDEEVIPTLYGNVIYMPDDPDRTGYEFLEWNTNPDGSGTAFESDTDVTEDITVYAQWNGLPVAQDDTAETSVNTPVPIDVRANDSDIEDSVTSLSIVASSISTPSNGTAVMTSDGTITYTPSNPTWTGIDTFTYKIKDTDGGESNTVTVTVYVGVSAPTGTVTLDKVDQDGDPLAGATFTLYNSSGVSQGTAVSAITTGVVTFADIAIGNGYYIEETSAPSGYTKASGRYTFNVGSDGSITEVSDTLRNASDKVVNTANTGTVTLDKVDQDGDPLAGATFTLYNSSGVSQGTAVSAVTTGVATFADIAIGNGYYIEETSAPSGYTKASGRYTFNVGSDGSITEVSDTLRNASDKVVNTANTGTVTLDKVDQDGDPLEGATFTLYNSSGVSQGTAVSAVTTGVATFADIAVGNGYYIEETSAPSGYTKASGRYTFNVGSDGSITEVSDTLRNASDKVVNTANTGTVTLDKVDQDGDPLAGATFTLYNSSGVSQGTAVSAATTGVATFADIAIGNGYYIEETTAPSGYTKSSGRYTFNVGSDGSITEVSDTLRNATDKVVNTANTGTVTLDKVDQDGDPLAGATFTLYNSSGVSQGTAVSAVTTGVVTFADIAVGNGYYIEETSAPSGYTKASGRYTFNVGNDGSITEVSDTLRNVSDKVVNTANTGTVTLDKVDQDGDPLAGATFTLYNSSGVSQGTAVSAVTTGVATFADIAVGNGYYIEETSAPSGYTKASGRYTFNVGSDGSITEVSDTLRNASDKVVNTANTGTVTLDKVDQDGDPLEGATFTLYNSSGVSQGTAVSAVTTGQATFADIAIGNGYYIEETSAPSGYTKSSGRYTFNVGSDGSITEVSDTLRNASDKVVNTANTGTVTLDKVDQDGDPLAGATFTLYNSSGVSQGTAVSAATTGVATFADIAVGNGYYIEETSAPSGYTKASGRYTFNVGSDGSITEVSDTLRNASDKVVNTANTGTVTLDKVDQDGDPLAGATFTLYNSSGVSQGTAVSAVTTGVATFADIAIGNGYYIEETSAPTGYTKASGRYTFNVGSDGSITEVSDTLRNASDKVVNTANTGTVTLDKVDQDNKVLAGATFTLYNKAGVEQGTATSTNRGKVTFSGIAVGNGYYIKETSPPDGYIAGSGKYTFNVNDDGTITEVSDTLRNAADKVVNTAVYSVGDYVWVDINADGVQDSGEKFLNGVIVSLYDNTTGKQIGSSVVTGGGAWPDGYYEFEGLTEGVYFVEFTLPPGYVFTSQNTGTDDTDDSDVDPSTGRTPPIELNSSNANLVGNHFAHLDAGVVPKQSENPDTGDDSGWVKTIWDMIVGIFAK